MTIAARLDRAAAELATIPRPRKPGRPVDGRYFQAFIEHCIKAGNRAPPGALEFALRHLREDEGPLNPALERSCEAVQEGAEPGKETRAHKLTAAEKLALERWYGCLLKGLPIPALLARQVWRVNG